MKTSITLSVLAALVLGSAAPAFAAGGWQAGGSVQEPSTAFDTSQYMHQTPNQEAVEKIYFNGFMLDGWLTTTDKNLEGATLTGPLVRFGAYLGFWRDCNGDGFIGAKSVPEAYAASYGHFSNGAYPADVGGVNPDVCPPGSVYNQGLFIDEFRWIGPNATPSEDELKRGDKYPCDPTKPVTLLDDCQKMWSDLHDVTDKDALAWLDLSSPEEEAANTKPVFAKELFDNSSATLYQTVGWLGLHELVEGRQVETPVGSFVPVEEGTYDSLPNFGDCGGAKRGEREFGGGEPFLGVTGTCGYYPLWQAKRLVNDSESEHDQGAEPLVYVYDTENDDDGSGSACDDTQLPGGFAMADVQPGVHENPETQGSLGGTIWSNVFAGAGTGSAVSLNGECDENSEPPTVLGSASGAAGKFRVDTFLIYYPDDRYRGLRTFGVDNLPTDGAGLLEGPASPTGSSRWLSFHVYIIIGAAGATNTYWNTFYADVSPETFRTSGASPTTALPASAQDAHEYGLRECGGNYDDTEANRVANEYGWICSQKAWQEEADEFNGDETAEGVDDRLRVVIGQKFDLRDADCYDMTAFAPANGQDGVDTNTGDVYVGVEGGETVTVRSTCRDGVLTPHVEAVNEAINNT